MNEVMLAATVLIAGIGNIFLGDDGFGVEVVARLRSERLPPWVRVVDFGIRGIHLAYELYDTKIGTLVIVDATARGGRPGDVYLLKIEPDAGAVDQQPLHDPHNMTPDAVLRVLKAAGSAPERIYLVGCEPACTEENIGLSEPVLQAVDLAVRKIRELVHSLAEGQDGHA